MLLVHRSPVSKDHDQLVTPDRCSALPRHCEERSDEAIQHPRGSYLDCFAALAMTLVPRSQ
jgi:hypothetical protein